MLSFYSSLIEEETEKITFERIYRDYHRQMLYVAKRFLPTREDAEDAVQEALIRIAKSIKLIPVGNHARQKAYIMTVVRNVALEMLSQKEKEVSYAEMPEVQTCAYPDPFTEIEKSEDYEALLAMIRSLPLVYQEVLLFRYVFDIPTKDIAAILNRKASTVKQQITRGKKMLSAIYEKEN